MKVNGRDDAFIVSYDEATCGAPLGGFPRGCTSNPVAESTEVYCAAGMRFALNFVTPVAPLAGVCEISLLRFNVFESLCTESTVSVPFSN